MQFQLRETGDGSHTLYSTAYQETFRSTYGALTETRHVFLRGTGVTERFQQKQPTRILEVGFGTSLNFLTTAALALTHETPLHYVAAEKDLLPTDLLRSLQYEHLFGNAHHLTSALLDWRKTIPASGAVRLH